MADSLFTQQRATKLREGFPYAIVPPARQSDVMEFLGRESRLALDFETTGLNYFEDKIIGAAVTCSDKSFYFCFSQRHLNEPCDRDKFLRWAADFAPGFVLHNAKFDNHFATTAGHPFKVVSDTMLKIHLQNPNDKMKLEEAGLRELGIDWTDGTYKDLVNYKKGQTLEDLCLETVANYACGDTWMTYALDQKLQVDPIQSNLWSLELQLIDAVIGMERTGILIDQDGLSKIEGQLQPEHTSLREELMEVLECDPNSKQRLGPKLIELGVPLRSKTPTGRIRVRAQDLKDHEDHPLISKLIRYNDLTKLLGTFLKHLSDDIYFDGRLHPNFNQWHVCTGRYSCSGPNCQNIPKREEVRNLFIPTPGGFLIEADYSQIEVRLLLMLADSPIKETLRGGADIHRTVASWVFEKSPDQISDEERRAAKTVVFGISYGQNYRGLAESLGVSTAKAASIIERFYNAMGGVKNYFEGAIQHLRDTGWVTTLMGRRRIVPEIRSKDRRERGFAERTARNHPIQGGAADLVKLGQLRVYNNMKAKYGDDARMNLTVHDSFMFDCAPAIEEQGYREELCRDIQTWMTHDIRGMLFPADVEAGPTWASLEPALN